MKMNLNEINPGIGETTGICECCGNEDFITKHHVVPYAFSKHFDSEVFPNNFLNLCRGCHDMIEIDLRKFRKWFRGKLGIAHEQLRQSDDHIRYKKAKAYAYQLVSNDSNIPQSKIMEMTVFIVRMYPDAYTREDFEAIAKDETMINATRTAAYGKIVADKIKSLELEEWFESVWKRKNKAVIRKLQKKGIEAERKRKRSSRHHAPEAKPVMVYRMLMLTEDMSEEQAEKFYRKADTDTRQSLRRCAFAWNKRRLKTLGLSDEANKKQTVAYISDMHSVSIETAGEMYRQAAKRKKKQWRKSAYETLQLKEGLTDDD